MQFKGASFYVTSEMLLRYEIIILNLLININIFNERNLNKRYNIFLGSLHFTSIVDYGILLNTYFIHLKENYKIYDY